MAKLVVVPTPIGNLDDMTFRGIKALKEADLILAEDTRTTSVLLKHFDIQKPMRSHHKFNEHQTVEEIAERILGGENIALVSDAGTPAAPSLPEKWVCLTFDDGPLPLLCRRWSTRGYLTTVSASRASCPRRKDGKHD